MDKSFGLISEVCNNYKGNLQEHQAIQQALAEIRTKLNQLKEQEEAKKEAPKKK